MGSGSFSTGSQKTATAAWGATPLPPILLPVHLPGACVFSLALAVALGRSCQTDRPLPATAGAALLDAGLVSDLALGYFFDKEERKDALFWEKCKQTKHGITPEESEKMANLELGCWVGAGLDRPLDTLSS